MIQLRVIDDKMCSMFICDVCGEPITNYKHAMIAMPRCLCRDKSKPDMEFLHVHKGECRDAVEEGAPIPEGAQFSGYGDLELRDHIISLLLNCGWDKKSMKEALSCWGSSWTGQNDD